MHNLYSFELKYIGIFYKQICYYLSKIFLFVHHILSMLKIPICVIFSEHIILLYYFKLF